ncbi:MAG: ABC transporter permease [Mesorhizobium sp.]|nr:ABC transporter permease [Mesorhizobium sp.]MBN9245526.1 ABC transporter permease [Mesorhizobium sp.]
MKLKREWIGLGLTAPAYAWLCVTVILPLAMMLYFSFLSKMPMGNAEPAFSLRQYMAFFQKDFYRFLAWRSLMLGFHVTLFCVLIGYPAAFVLARLVKGRWREAILLLVVLPFWSNALIRIFAWTMVLRTDGIVDQMLHFILPGAPSIGILYSYPAIVIGLVHSFLPYMILTCYISLQAIDDTLVEAGQALGASNLTVFRRIILPLSLPGLFVGVVLIFVPVVGAFMEPRILGGRQSIMLGTVIEDQFTEVFNWPLGAALSFTLLAIVSLIFLAAYPLLKNRLKVS